MYCKNCGVEIKDGSQFCESCGAAATTPKAEPPKAQSAKSKKPITKKWWFWVIAVFLIIGIFSSIGSKGDPAEEPAIAQEEQAEAVPVTAEPEEEEKETASIDAELFDKTARETLAAVDEAGLIGEIKTDVYQSNVFVSIYLADTSTWGYTTEVDQKEFINTLGNLMEQIAATSINGDPSTITVGAETVVFTPSGVELGKRTIWGNVKLAD